MGLRDIERKIKSKSAYQRKEGELLLKELDHMIENVETLKEQLKKFEKVHGKNIENNKDFYSKVSELRENLGLPEEIGVYDWKDSPSFKDKFGKSDYYDQLAHEILKLGKQVINDIGGLISVAEIVLRINKSRPGKLVPPRDILKALNLLIKDKLISPLKKLDSGVIIVEFVNIEMSTDQETVFNIASKHGFLTKETLIIQLGWNAKRSSNILEELVKTGVALKDETYHEGIKYWFPSLGQ